MRWQRNPHLGRSSIHCYMGRQRYAQRTRHTEQRRQVRAAILAERFVQAPASFRHLGHATRSRYDAKGIGDIGGVAAGEGIVQQLLLGHR